MKFFLKKMWKNFFTLHFKLKSQSNYFNCNTGRNQNMLIHFVSICIPRCLCFQIVYTSWLLSTFLRWENCGSNYFQKCWSFLRRMSDDKMSLTWVFCNLKKHFRLNSSKKDRTLVTTDFSATFLYQSLFDSF